MNHILIGLFSLLFVANAHAQSPIRAGLEFSDSAAPAFNDENLLSAIKTSVENSGVTTIFTIRVSATTDKIGVSVRGPDKNSEFICRVENGKTHCESAGKSWLQTGVIHQVEIPFGNIKSYGFKAQDNWQGPGIAGWVAIAVVAVYGGKKVLNKITTGKFMATHDEHSHIFLQQPEMREEMKRHKVIVDNAVEKAARNLQSDLLHVAAPLVEAASCGHRHDHDHDIKCEGIDESATEAAQQTLLKSFPGFAALIAKDFYNEVISPVVEVARAARDESTRRQILSFIELVSLRMVKERGLGPAIATGAFAVTGQVVVETLESFVLPAGAHMFCQIGNVAVLGVAASAYTAYYCLRQTQEMKGLTLAERAKVIRQISRLNWRANQGENAKTSDLTPNERLALSFHLLFKIVERDVRHARNLTEITKPESRQLAGKLGELKRDLNLISLRLMVNPVEDLEIQNWLKSLAALHATLFNKEESCEDHLLLAEAS